MVRCIMFIYCGHSVLDTGLKKKRFHSVLVNVQNASYLSDRSGRHIQSSALNLSQHLKDWT